MKSLKTHFNSVASTGIGVWVAANMAWVPFRVSEHFFGPMVADLTSSNIAYNFGLLASAAVNAHLGWRIGKAGTKQVLEENPDSPHPQVSRPDMPQNRLN